MALKFRLISRWGDFLYEPNVGTFDHTEEINGQDYITFTTDRPLSWGDRIVWEENGVWHEHVVNEAAQTHRGGETYRITAINSFQWDTSLRMVNKTRWNGANLQYAVTELLKLSPTWKVGTAKASSSKNLEYERESCYDAILKTCGTFNCEILRQIEVGKNGVTKRTISFVDHIGTQRDDVRFDYGAGMTGVDKNILSDSVITACYGFGSGVDDEELWCYITNDAALEYWGLPDGSGKVMHAEGIFTDPEIEDMATLREKTTEYLNAHSAPTINYVTDIPFVSLKGVSLGDYVVLVDTEFTPEIRMYARIGGWTRSKVGDHLEATSVTFGSVISVVPDALGRANQQEKVIVRQNETIGNLRGDLQQAQSDLSSTRSSLSTAQRTISQLQTDLAATELALSSANRELETAKSDAAAAKKQANELATTVESQKGQISDLDDRVSDLEAHYRSAQAAANYYGIVSTYHGMCVDGSTPMQQWIKNNLQMYKRDYDAHPDAALGNPTIDAWYNELMALPVSDEPLPGPSIEDEPTDDTSEPPKEE